MRQFICAVLLLSLTACSRQLTETGKASFYADKFDGRKTSSGEVFHQDKNTAAHKTLPFGTKVTVKNLLQKWRSILSPHHRPYLQSISQHLHCRYIL